MEVGKKVKFLDKKAGHKWVSAKIVGVGSDPVLMRKAYKIQLENGEIHFVAESQRGKHLSEELEPSSVNMDREEPADISAKGALKSFAERETQTSPELSQTLLKRLDKYSRSK